MYFVPDGTKRAGYYECTCCNWRFLSELVSPRIICPYCGEEPDMEIGPDEEMPTAREDAVLMSVIEGAADVEEMDALLSLAITGGNPDSWI